MPDVVADPFEAESGVVHQRHERVAARVELDRNERRVFFSARCLLAAPTATRPHRSDNRPGEAYPRPGSVPCVPARARERDVGVDVRGPARQPRTAARTGDGGGEPMDARSRPRCHLTPRVTEMSLSVERRGGSR